MCNDTLELLRIKDENIKYINQEIDVIIKGKKATVVNAVLTYKRFFIFYGGKVKLPAFFNTQKAQLPL
ncbi:hypothetical protein [Staphylococcus aureus]|uniref:hypothetical protein n=1 Tax=Staphylococcus aureus TaxID=1280 RepID=UPI001A8EE6A9|nr:hypothetical protein [Staphylococcus aureus]